MIALDVENGRPRVLDDWFIWRGEFFTLRAAGACVIGGNGVVVAARKQVRLL
jgi:hypothetical protein